MNDIDFDELDKAVNSLVDKDGGAPGKPTTPQPPAKPQTASPSADSTPTLVKVTSGSETQDSGMPSHRRLGVRPRGGFMDIVAPKKPTATIKKPSRVGQTVEPTHTVITPEPPTATKADSEPEPKLKKSVEPKSEPTTAPNITEQADESPTPHPRETPVSESTPKTKQDEVAWPDPLDFQDDEAEKPPVDTQQAKSEVSAPPTASPFIEGAKVEKRPLGAFAHQANPAEIVEPQTERDTDPLTKPEPDTQKEPESSEPASTVPEKEPPQEPSEPKFEPETQLEPESELESEPESSSKSNTEQQLHDSAMMSIPKQYKTAPKAVDQSNRPVFDTKEYHPPLLEATAHAAHRGSMWGKLFTVLLVVALLAVAGYFAFIYVVENL